MLNFGKNSKKHELLAEKTMTGGNFPECGSRRTTGTERELVKIRLTYAATAPTGFHDWTGRDFTRKAFFLNFGLPMNRLAEHTSSSDISRALFQLFSLAKGYFSGF